MKRSQIQHRPLAETVLGGLEREAKDYRELDSRGLYFRVKPTGEKTWEIRHKNTDGKWSWKCIGSYPRLDGQQARAKAELLLSFIKRGGNLGSLPASIIHGDGSEIVGFERELGRSKEQASRDPEIHTIERQQDRKHSVRASKAQLFDRRWIDPDYVQVSRKDAALILGVSPAEFDRLRHSDAQCPRGFRNGEGRSAKVRFRLSDVYEYSESRMKQAVSFRSDDEVSMPDQLHGRSKPIASESQDGFLSFRDLAEEWYQWKANDGLSRSRLAVIRSVLDEDLLPWIGHRSLVGSGLIDPEYVQVCRKEAARILGMSPTEFDRLRRNDPECPRGYRNGEGRGAKVRFRLLDVYRYSEYRIKTAKVVGPEKPD